MNARRPDGRPAFRVVRCYFRLPPEPGGMEQHIAQLSAEQRNLDVEVLNLFNAGVADGPSVQVFAGRDLLGVRPAFLRNLLFYFAGMARRKELKGRLPTILHVHGDWSDFILARMLAKRIRAVAVAASLHDRISPRRSQLYRFALKDVGIVFCTGKGDQTTLEQVLGRPVHHVPSAPRNEFFSAPKSGPPFRYDVIGVANLLSKKAPDVFLECARRRPELRFALFGEGELRPALHRRIEEAAIANIDLPGKRPASEIASALSSSRAFLSTSLVEGTPTAALEAMAIGLPVVLTPSNDYSWLIENGVNGYVTSGWRPEEILARVDDVLGDENSRQAIGRANAAVAARHKWEATARFVTDRMAETVEGVR